MHGNGGLATNQPADQVIEGQLAGTVADRDQQQQPPHLVILQPRRHQFGIGNDGQNIEHEQRQRGVTGPEPKMWHDICVANREQLLEMIALFSTDLARLAEAIRADDRAAVLAMFQRAKRARDNLYLE